MKSKQILVLWILGLAFGIYVGTGAWLNYRQTSSVILRPGAATKTPQRYIIWNKAAFVRTVGVRTLDIAPLTALGARNIKQLEIINGATFEADPEAHNKISALSAQAGSEWVIQPEYRHGILPWKCSRCEDVTCPNPAPNPGPNPSPQPQPNPNPSPQPVEPSRSWGRDRVHAPAAMAAVSTSDIRICDVDTGIDLRHPARGNIIGSIGLAGPVQDGNGHGTHTAGTLAGLGGVGVSRAKLLICKGLEDSGSGSSSALAQCLTWCGQQGAQIVSNSWGSPQSDPLINQAITALTQRGIYVFVAAGNDSGPVNWPAKLAGNNPLVFAIAASGSDDRITSFSSRGPEVRFISPGANITSNWPGGGIRALDGTSMATPHAAAVCAFGIARGKRPCVTATGKVSGYDFADALESAQ